VTKSGQNRFGEHGPLGVKKWFFWPSKLYYPLRTQEKKTFFVNFERYDLANGEE
jgi:hypothetical protein